MATKNKGGLKVKSLKYNAVWLLKTHLTKWKKWYVCIFDIGYCLEERNKLNDTVKRIETLSYVWEKSVWELVCKYEYGYAQDGILQSLTYINWNKIAQKLGRTKRAMLIPQIHLTKICLLRNR